MLDIFHQRIKQLEDALRPFAEAARRIDYYDGERFNGALYASSNGAVLIELLDGREGEPLKVDHLRAAREALADA